MGHPYPGTVGDHVASQRRGQAHGFLFELAQLLTEGQAFGVHNDVDQRNGGACVMRGLGSLVSVCYGLKTMG